MIALTITFWALAVTAVVVAVVSLLFLFFLLWVLFVPRGRVSKVRES